MSAPVNDDRDKRAMYVPPWARDEMHDEETRRIHAEIVQAAERMKPAAPPPQRPSAAPEVEACSALRGRAASAGPRWWRGGGGAARGVGLRRSRMRTLSRLAGAGGFAAIVALVVTGAVPLPSIDISLSGDRKDANAAALQLQQVPAMRPKLAAAPPVAQPRHVPSVRHRHRRRLGSSCEDDSGAQRRLLRRFYCRAPKVAERSSRLAPKPPCGLLPEARVLDFMSREEIDGLLKRGQDLRCHRRHFRRPAAADARGRGR